MLKCLALFICEEEIRNIMHMRLNVCIRTINPRNFPEYNHIVDVLVVSDTLSFANLDAIDVFRI